MSFLLDRVQTLSDFQFSLNVGYDLYSDDKIKNYIPTASAIAIIEDVLLSVSETSNERARIFVGAYGKGKSHLCLVLVSMLFRKELDLFNNLFDSIQRYKPDLYNYVEAYINSDKKMLPVIVSGSQTGLRQSLMLELQKALSSVGLYDIMPDTYFKAAITTIENWKNNYPETYAAFQMKITSSISDFILELSLFNIDFYNLFTKVYPVLTSGSEFNPVTFMDVVELYNNVNEKVKEYGYSGIFVLYDEFSKYLEGNINRTTADDIKALQDFAENCCRSKDRQLHIMLVSHQSILNYIDKLPKNKIDAWKAVSERFKSIEINHTSAQMYEITSRVIHHDFSWYEDFKYDYREAFVDILGKWKRHRAFSELTNAELNTVVYGCYPLEPMTTYLLPKISEKIAQNERTLFTFLSSDGQKHTLNDFIKTAKGEFPLLTPDSIFDYFSPLFKADSYNSICHKFWKIATVALNKISIDSEVERRIIKTVALIYIYNQFEILPPDTSMVIDIYNGSVYPIHTVTQALTSLLDKGIIKRLNNKNYLRIAEHTEENIDEIILNTIAKRATRTKVKTILNSFTGDRVLYPNAYNDKNEIVRYFDFEFITGDEVLEVSDWDMKINDIDGDGAVYAVILKYEQHKEVLNRVKEIRNERILFILTLEIIDIYNDAIKYDAIKYIIEHSDDNVLIDELSYALDDLSDGLNRYVDTYLRPEIGGAIYYYQGDEIKLSRRSALSRKLSDICESVFYMCPSINNEIINKNSITSTAMNSRAKVIAGLLESEIKPDLGLVGTGQDVSFMRSTIKVTGMLTETDNQYCLSITNLKDIRLSKMLQHIEEFFIQTSTSGPTSFQVLYDYLSLPSNNIGLKKGVIPIYIAAVLHFYKKYVAITTGRNELEITAKLLENINEHPDNYAIYLEKWDQEKGDYISGLESIFENHVNEHEKEFNNFEYIVKAIKRWFLQLPKYTKDAQKVYGGSDKFNIIEKQIISFMQALKSPQINAREFLFVKSLRIFGYDSFSLDIIKDIQAAKTFLDNIINEQIRTLEIEIRSIFESGIKNDKATTTSVIKDWCDTLNKDVFSHVFSGNENTLLNICKGITADSFKFVEYLAKESIGLRIEDWNDDTILSFTSTIRAFKISVEAYNNNITGTGNKAKKVASYKIGFITDEGVETFKTFDKAIYSAKAQLMLNDAEALLDEYGEALSPSEKRQVLMDTLSKLLN